MSVVMGKIVEVNNISTQLILQAGSEEELKKQVKAISEMERKAKAFNKISNLIEENYVDYGENDLEDVEAIVNEYWEDE